MLLVDRIAQRRGKWVHEVLDLSFEGLSYELAADAAHDRYVAGQADRITQAKGWVFTTLPLR